MRAIRSPRAGRWEMPVREAHRDGPITTARHSFGEDPFQRTVAELRSIAPATVRLLALATIAMLLLIVSLPAATSGV